MRFREDGGCMRNGNAPAVMGSLCQAVLNMARTLQQDSSSDVSIGLLRDRFGLQP